MTKFGEVKIPQQSMSPVQQMVYQMWTNDQQIPDVYLPVLRKVINLPSGVRTKADWKQWSALSLSINNLFKTVQSFHLPTAKRRERKEFFGLFENV